MLKKRQKKIYQKGGNVFEVSRLLTKYRAGHVTAALVSHIPEQIQQKIQENAFSDLLDIYTDVYADVFAIQILGISDFKSYCDMIHLFTGTAIYKAVTRSTNILRIATISRICFNEPLNDGGEKILQDLLISNKIPNWQHDEIKRTWHRVMKASYFEEICRYAEKCKIAVDDTVQQCIKNKSAELNALRSVFSNENQKNEISFIEIFWKYLLEEQV